VDRRLSFAASSVLWLLPILGGGIVLLYLLKMRRRDLKVPATFLWPAMTYEIRANALFQRLRFNWLMVLQLLILTALVVGLAQPQCRREGLTGEVTVIVLDASASMKATDVQPSRFAVAQSEAQALINSKKPADRMAVVLAGPVPRVAYSLGNDAAALRRAVNSAEGTDAESDIGEAMRLAGAIAGKIAGARIILISDGVFPEVTNFGAGKAKVEFRSMGTRQSNVAIQALGVDQGYVYFGVKNYGLDAQKASLTLYADGKVLNAFNFSVGGGKTYGKTLLAPKQAEVIEAKLDVADDLAADNYAVCLAGGAAQIKALLVSPGNLFLERALSLDPRLVLDKSPSLPTSARDGAYDLVVFDGVPEQPVQAKAILSFGKARPGKIVRNPALVEARGEGSFADVDLGGGFAAEAVSYQPKPGETTFIQSGNLPLVVGSKGKIPSLYVAIDPLKSDLPLQPAFPVLVGTALDWLFPAGRLSGVLAADSGRTLSLEAEGLDELTILSPQGKQRLEATNGRFVLRRLAEVGTYTLQYPTPRKLYVQLRSENESNIKPRDSVTLGSAPVSQLSSIWSLADLWPYFAGLALLILAFEWWLFARKS